MGLLSRLVEWATAGTKVKVPAGYIAAGWITGKPPAFEYWNYRENERDTLINASLDLAESSRTAPPQATAGDIASGMQLHEQWFEPASSPNVLTSTDVYRDSCVGYDPSTGEPVLIVVTDDNDICPVVVWDYTADPTLGTPYNPTLASMDEVWSVCCDGSDLYVAWTVTAGNLCVSKFSLNWTGSPVWTVNTTVAASTLSGESIKLIEADANNIAMLFAATPVVADNGSIGILNKSTGAFAYGNGNADPTENQTLGVNAKIVSNGTSIFWISWNTIANEFELCAADISDPTIGTPTKTQISSMAVGGASLGLACIGDYVLASTASGSVIGYSSVNDDVKTFLKFTLPAPFEQATEHDLLIGFDGLNVWFYHLYEGTSLNAIGVRGVPASFFSRRVIGSYPRECDVPPVYFDTDIAATYELSGVHPAGKLLFDGRDVWLVGRYGDLFRICNPGARGW